jgi:V/A-type H+-transporting ATPase subunit I
LYGMVLRMYREARRGDWVAAVCDGGLWLLFLPGLIMLLAAGLAPVPGWVSRVGLILLGTGAAGLVLTQGRREKGLFAKALTGIVSLYGILGTYGTTSFIGDTLSYSRLLALGLTTTIVGMCFNIIAGLVKGVPVAGVLIVMLVLLVGHLFNILVSILGAFVHSGRLIFVEFFGRFYEVGGKRFRALGTSDRVRIVGVTVQGGGPAWSSSFRSTSSTRAWAGQ